MHFEDEERQKLIEEAMLSSLSGMPSTLTLLSSGTLKSSTEGKGCHNPDSINTTILFSLALG